MAYWQIFWFVFSKPWLLTDTPTKLQLKHFCWNNSDPFSIENVSNIFSFVSKTLNFLTVLMEIFCFYVGNCNVSYQTKKLNWFKRKNSKSNKIIFLIQKLFLQLKVIFFFSYKLIDFVRILWNICLLVGMEVMGCKF